MRALSFPLTLSTGLCTVSVETEDGRHTVAAVKGTDGREAATTLSDLDAIEAVLDAATEAAVEALDVMTGGAAMFTVLHSKGRVLSVAYETGILCRRSSEQFTETAEAFALDLAAARWEAEEEARHDAFAKF